MLDAVFPVAVLLAVVNKAIVDYLSAPVKQRYPDADLWWLVYVAFATGMALGLVAGINLFGGIASMPELAGRILTGACIGGGANFLHDVAKRRNELPEQALPLITTSVPSVRWPDDETVTMSGASK